MKKFLIALLVVIILFVAYLAYLGTFTTVKFQEQKVEKMTLVYLENVGDYSQVHLVMDDVYTKLTEKGIETTKGFGIYFDDPKNVAPEKLKSEIGCILPEKYMDKIEELKTEFKIKELPMQECYIAEMPYRSKMAIIVGVVKVYPALEEFSNTNNVPDGPIMEIYDEENQVIQYVLLKELKEKEIINESTVEEVMDAKPEL